MILPWSYHVWHEPPESYHVSARPSCLTMAVSLPCFAMFEYSVLINQIYSIRLKFSIVLNHESKIITSICRLFFTPIFQLRVNMFKFFKPQNDPCTVSTILLKMSCKRTKFFGSNYEGIWKFWFFRKKFPKCSSLWKQWWVWFPWMMKHFCANSLKMQFVHQSLNRRPPILGGFFQKESKKA